MSADKDFIAKVEEILEEVRPMLLNHGGDLDLVEVTDDKIVKVRLKGACGSCPMSTFTIKMGVEKALKDRLPEVKGVESVI
jgi:Fe-S cluster biogenesis protein NfuA